MNSRAIISDISPFDILEGTIFTFTGFQLLANHNYGVLFYEGDSLNSIGYANLKNTLTKDEEDSNQIHTVEIPNNQDILTNAYWQDFEVDKWVNNKVYCLQLAEIVITFGSREFVNLSERMFFKTIDTPSFSFNNSEDIIVVNKTYFTISTLYRSLKGERLRSYYYVLYDSIDKKNIVKKSETFYSQSTSLTMNYTFKGLLNGTYFVQAYVLTKSGLNLSTELKQVNVNHPKSYLDEDS